MTKQEAIEYLSNHYLAYVKHLQDNEEMIDKHNSAMDIAIKCIGECIKHEETFEWCPDCKEYDQEHHCCHRWSKRIRETAKELEVFYKLESKGLVPQTTVRGLIGGKNNV